MNRWLALLLSRPRHHRMTMTTRELTKLKRLQPTLVGPRCPEAREPVAPSESNQFHQQDESELP